MIEMGKLKSAEASIGTDVRFDLGRGDLFDEVDRLDIPGGKVVFRVPARRAGRIFLPSDSLGNDCFIIMDSRDRLVDTLDTFSSAASIHPFGLWKSFPRSTSESFNWTPINVEGIVAPDVLYVGEPDKMSSESDTRASTSTLPRFSAAVHRALGWTAGAAGTSFVLTSAGLLFSNFVLGFLGGLALAVAAIAAVVWLGRAEREHPETT